MTDQAESLRRMVARARTPPRRARVLAIASGKGGVGKTHLSVNLSYALRRLGHEVVLLDADLGLANVDVLLGTTPRYHLGHLLTGERTVRELIYTAPEGLRLVAGGSGLAELSRLGGEALRRFVDSLGELQDEADYLLVDTGAGIGEAVTTFTLAADEVVVVTTPEPTALTDAYALIKTLFRQQPSVRLRLIVNQVQNQQEAQEAAYRLTTTALRFLGVSLEVLGYVPHDRQVLQAVRRQTPFVLASPECPAAKAVTQIARQLAGQPPQAPSLFLERLLRWLGRRS